MKFTLTAQNDAQVLQLPRAVNGYVQITTASTAPAGAVIVLEVSGVEGEFITVQVMNPATRTAAANLTGPSKTGYAEVPAYAAVRARRTDANGTAADGVIEFRANGI